MVLHSRQPVAPLSAHQNQPTEQKVICGMMQAINKFMCTMAPVGCWLALWHLAGSGTTGSIASTIVDNTGTSRSVLQSLLNDTVVAITSSVAFTPQTAVSGFATISEGINLSTTLASNKLRHCHRC